MLMIIKCASVLSLITSTWSLNLLNVLWKSGNGSPTNFYKYKQNEYKQKKLLVVDAKAWRREIQPHPAKMSFKHVRGLGVITDVDLNFQNYPTSYIFVFNHLRNLKM